MNFFKQFKTYLVPELSEPINKKQNCNTDSFQYIVSDLLQPQQNNSDYFEELIPNEPINQEEEICNLYFNDLILVEKYSQGRSITIEQWKEILNSGNIKLQPKKNIYFSILKGIDFTVRKDVWQLLAKTNEMTKMTNLSYKELKNPICIMEINLNQIDKDVPRTKTITKFTSQLRSILIAYVNLTGKSYTQGMNLIGGCLLELLSLQNDEQLHSFEIVEQQFEERVFWVFVGIMKAKHWQDLFVKDMSGLTKMLNVLKKLMIEHVPLVYKKIRQFEWDMTIFSQYYLTIMIYNTPKKLSQIILDLFLLEGENILHSLIIRIMKIHEDKIIAFQDQGELMGYFKSGILKDCLVSIEKQQKTASKLQDFDLNFIKTAKI